MEENVVLVDENNNILGSMPKQKVHGLSTPLHRAFSVFIFNHKKQLLLQQRSHKKLTWPLVWSNSCCGHPLPKESESHAIERRVSKELGSLVSNIQFISPYRYCFTWDNITENEICPIFVATIAAPIHINPDEVEATRWIAWEDWIKEINQKPGAYSEWCIEESLILHKSPLFKRYLNKLTSN